MRNNNNINKKYWRGVDPGKIMSGLCLPGIELKKHLKSGSKILDIGSGPGKISEYLTKEGYDVVGVDINKAALKLAQKKNTEAVFKYADITNKIPFKDEVFDAVVVSYVFVSIISPLEQLQASKEISRVLKEGGYLWICEATFSPDYKERYKKGKEVTGKELMALSYDKKGKVKRIIKHYQESQLDNLFDSFTKIDSSRLIVVSPSSGMNVESLRIVYRK